MTLAMKHRFHIVMLILLMTGCAVYTGMWMWYAQTVKQSTALYLDNLRADGNEVIVNRLTVGGFPFSIALVFSGTIISGDYHITIPVMEARSLFIPGTPITIDFNKGLSLAAPYDTQLWSADSLTLSGTIPEHIPDSLMREDMRRWYTENGAIVLHSLEIYKDRLHIKGNGLLSLDENLQPKARFQAVVTGHVAFLQWLTNNSYVETKQALISATILAGLTRVNETTGENFMPVDLLIDNRRLFVGPLQVTTLPAIIWPSAH